MYSFLSETQHVARVVLWGTSLKSSDLIGRLRIECDLVNMEQYRASIYTSLTHVVGSGGEEWGKNEPQTDFLVVKSKFLSPEIQTHNDEPWRQECFI